MKKIILALIFATVSSYKTVECNKTQFKLEEIRKNLSMADKDLQEVSIVISNKKILKKIQRKIRNETN